MDNEKILTFDDANAAMEAAMEPEAEAAMEAEPVREAAMEAAMEPGVTEQAVRAAEVAAGAAAEKDAQFRQAMMQMEQIGRENQELKQMLAQLSQKQEERIVEEAVPALDLSGVAFGDEENMRARQAEYAAQMAEYTKRNVMKDLEPFMQYARQGMAARQTAEAAARLKNDPNFADIGERMPQIERIIANNPALRDSNGPLMDKLVTAYAMSKWAEGMNQKAGDPTAAFLDAYKNTPELRDAVEKLRLTEAKDKPELPAFSANGGAAGAAVTIPKQPRTLDEAGDMFRRMMEQGLR